MPKFSSSSSLKTKSLEKTNSKASDLVKSQLDLLRRNPFPANASNTSLLDQDQFENLCKKLNKFYQNTIERKHERGFNSTTHQDILEAYKDYQRLNILTITDNQNEIFNLQTEVQIISDSILDTIVFYSNVQRDDSTLDLTESITNILLVGDDISTQRQSSKLYLYLSVLIRLIESFTLDDANPYLIMIELRTLINDLTQSIRSLINLPRLASMDIDDLDIFTKWKTGKRNHLVDAYSKILKTCYILMDQIGNSIAFESHYRQAKDDSDVLADIQEPLSNFGERLEGMDTFIYTLSDSFQLGIRVSAGLFNKTDFICRRMTGDYLESRLNIIPFLSKYDQILSEVYEIKVNKPVKIAYIMLTCETNYLSDRRIVQLKYTRDRQSNVNTVNAYQTKNKQQEKTFCARIRLIKNNVQLMLTCKPAPIELMKVDDSFNHMRGIANRYNPDAEEYHLQSTSVLNNDPLWSPRLTILRIPDKLLDHLRIPISPHSSIEIESAALIEIDLRTDKKSFPSSVTFTMPNVLTLMDEFKEPLTDIKRKVPVRLNQFDLYAGLKATPTSTNSDISLVNKEEIIINMPILPHMELKKQTSNDHSLSNLDRKRSLGTDAIKKSQKEGPILLFGHKRYYNSKTNTTGFWVNETSKISLDDRKRIKFEMNNLLSPLLFIRTQPDPLSFIKIDGNSLCDSITATSTQTIVNVFVFQRTDVIKHISGHFYQSLIVIVCPTALIEESMQMIKKRMPSYILLTSDKLVFSVNEIAELIIFLDGNLASPTEDCESLPGELMSGPVGTTLRKIFHLNIYQRFINQLTINICPMNLFSQGVNLNEFQGALHFYIKHTSIRESVDMTYHEKRKGTSNTLSFFFD